MKKAPESCRKHFLFVILLTSLMAIAGKPPVPGYFIRNNGDTVRTKFVLPLLTFGERSWYLHIQDRQKYLDAAGEGEKMNPEEISEFAFEAEGQLMHYKAVPVTWNPLVSGRKMFLRCITEGKCELYYYYETSTKTNEITEAPVFRIRNKDPYFAPRVVIGRTYGRMVNGQQPEEYFSDCPQLAGKLREKELSLKDDLQVAKFYNEQCR